MTLFNLVILFKRALYKQAFQGLDFIVTPIVILLLLLITFHIYRKKYSKTVYGKYYLLAFAAKMIGTVIMALLYRFFFDGGDTFNYFNGASTMFRTLTNEFWSGVELYLYHPDNYSESTRMLANRATKGFHPGDPETLIYKIGGWLSLITFRSYFGICLFITYYAFSGYWKLYMVFVDLYPKYVHHFAFGILLIPTSCLYGTGLMKDPIVTGALCYMTYDVYQLLFKKRHRVMSYIRIPISFYFLVTIKAYIIAMFIPPLFFWIFLTRMMKVKSSILRKFLWPITIVTIGSISIAGSNFLGSQVSSRYTLENALESSVKIANWIAYKTEVGGGTSYSLGKLEPNIQSVLSKIPAALNVTFFRPYFWDVKGPAYYPIVIESLLTMLFTIYVFLRVGVFRAFGLMFKDPNLFFCLSFAILFGFFVGFISQNFGALVRYKLPCMPFYYSGLIILLSYSKRKLKFK